MEENQDKKHEFYPMETTGTLSLYESKYWFWDWFLILKLFQETKQDSRKSQAVSLMCIETKMTENGAF